MRAPRPPSVARRVLAAFTLLSLALAPRPASSQSLAPGPQSPTPWSINHPPAPRTGQSAAWDPVGRQLLVFGGEGGSKLRDLWGFRPSERRWVDLAPSGEPPSSGAAHSAVWDPTRNQLLIYGGFGGPPTSALWALRPPTPASRPPTPDPRPSTPNPHGWERPTPAGLTPSSQGYHTAVWDTSADRMLVFGGIGPSFGLINDLWAYAPATNTWTPLRPAGFPPPPILLHAAVWDPGSSQMLVFGGVDPVGGKPTDELWAYQSAPNTWNRLSPDSPKPPARLSAGTVWDPRGQQLLIFGGSCGGGCYLNDVWSYRPADNRWIELPMVGQRPLDRAGHSAVWDPTQDRVLIFGGSAGPDFLNDVWTYRPATYQWEHVAAASAPSPDFSPLSVWNPDRAELIAFDSVTRRLRLYRLGARTLGVWRASAPPLETWSELETFPEPPAGRQEPTLVWDSTGQRGLMFGGYWEGRFSAELWELLPQAAGWRQLTSSRPSPPARFRHSAIWDPAGHMYVFGGTNSRGDLDDLWRYDAADNHWEEIRATGPRPSARASHTAVWDVTAHRMVIFGGLHGDVLSDAWSFDPELGAWSLLPPHSLLPAGRFGHAAVWAAEIGRMLVVGGTGHPAPGEVLSYETSTNTWERSPVVSELGGRTLGPASWDPTGRRLLVFAQRVFGAPAELWSFSPHTRIWRQPPLTLASPLSRTGHSLVWDDARRQALLFGGSRESDTRLGDLWSYQAATGGWVELEANGSLPPDRTEHAAAWDGAGRRMFVFGGRGAGGALADLWVFEASDHLWRQIEPPGPAPGPREELSAVWDSRHSRLLVYGGVRDGRTLDDLWTFDPSIQRWTQIDSAENAPLGRYRHTATWDAAGQKMLVFGGYGGAFPGTYLNDLWAFDPLEKTWTRLDSQDPLPPRDADPLPPRRGAPESGAAPGPRAHHAAAWDGPGHRLLIFGGFAGGIDYRSDLWAFDPVAMGWTQLSAAEADPRAGHGVAWDVVTRRLLVFGGQANGLYADLATYQEEPAILPGPP